MLWFGETWGAPICEPEKKVTTPVGQECLECKEPILANDQGVMMPFTDFVHGEPRSRMIAEHLDCFLDTILPHGPDCPRCRGLERNEHVPGCVYKTDGGECSCENGKRMQKLLEPTLTLAEAQEIADDLHVELNYLLDLVRKRRTRRNAHARRRSEA